MKHQAQSYPVMQNKHFNFGDQYESGYSTTTSSEEGTLQRGFTQTKKQGGFEGESFLKNPKFLEMVSKETAASETRSKRSNKKRSKTYDYSESPVSFRSSEGSPRSAPSPLTFGIPDNIPTSNELRHDCDDVINMAALQKFRENLENIRTYQTAKPPTFGKPAFDHAPYYDPLRVCDVRNGTFSKSPSTSSISSGTDRSQPARGRYNLQSSSNTPTKSIPVQFSDGLSKSVEDFSTIKAITPPASTQRKSAFVVVKPRVVKGAREHSCSHDTSRQSGQVQLPTCLNYRPASTKQQTPSPRNSKIVYIPAQIDENGVARPVSNYLSGPSCNHHNNSKRCSKNSNVSKPQQDLRSTELPAAELLSNEAVRLRKYLEKADAKNLKKVLENLLKSKDPKSINAMTKIFPGSKFKADAAHCVRCHKDFNPNEPGRCILPHPERMVTRVSQDSIGADFQCGCCSAEFRLIQMDFYEESTNAFLTGHCYSGTHTTDPNCVDYRIDGGSAKSCEEFGCIEFYV